MHLDRRVGNIAPVQNNIHTMSSPSSDYDTSFAEDSHYFDGIAHFIPHIMAVSGADPRVGGG